MFETPILLIIFNRPDTTRRVFEAIRQHKPKYLFVAADGPRPDKPDDTEKCKAAREVIKVDWDCKLQTQFRDENRGCGYGPAEAITWFFKNVEMGIILEDDCLPANDFFRFCEGMLLQFKNDQRIAIISGTNNLRKWKINRKSYIISKFGGTWGWASWRRAWKYFDHNMGSWNPEEGKMKIKKFLGNKSYYKYFENEFNIYCLPERRKDVWDYQWVFSRFSNAMYSVVPCVNLISNIGFGEDAHHTLQKNQTISEIPTYKLTFPVKNQKFHINKFYDWYVFQRFMNPQKRSLYKRIVLKLLKVCTNTNQTKH